MALFLNNELNQVTGLRLFNSLVKSQKIDLRGVPAMLESSNALAVSLPDSIDISQTDIVFVQDADDNIVPQITVNDVLITLDRGLNRITGLGVNQAGLPDIKPGSVSIMPNLVFSLSADAAKTNAEQLALSVAQQAVATREAGKQETLVVKKGAFGIITELGLGAGIMASFAIYIIKAINPEIDLGTIESLSAVASFITQLITIGILHNIVRLIPKAISRLFSRETDVKQEAELSAETTRGSPETEAENEQEEKESLQNAVDIVKRSSQGVLSKAEINKYNKMVEAEKQGKLFHNEYL
ncbi:MAG: hypothetical protein US83_C0022G0001, partial [Candidatus Falkowbacteria bacterium GW2011_GWC2_38_22]